MKKKLEEIIKNSYSICCFINDYETLEKVLDEIEEINSLRESILHDLILSSALDIYAKNRTYKN